MLGSELSHAMAMDSLVSVDSVDETNVEIPPHEKFVAELSRAPVQELITTDETDRTPVISRVAGAKVAAGNADDAIERFINTLTNSSKLAVTEKERSQIAPSPNSTAHVISPTSDVASTSESGLSTRSNSKTISENLEVVIGGEKRRMEEGDCDRDGVGKGRAKKPHVEESQTPQQKKAIISSPKSSGIRSSSKIDLPPVEKVKEYDAIIPETSFFEYTSALWNEFIRIRDAWKDSYRCEDMAFDQCLEWSSESNRSDALEVSLEDDQRRQERWAALGIAGTHAVSRIAREQHQLCVTLGIEVCRCASLVVTRLATSFYASLNAPECQKGEQSGLANHGERLAGQPLSSRECQKLKDEIFLSAGGLDWNSSPSAALNASLRTDKDKSISTAPQIFAFTPPSAPKSIGAIVSQFYFSVKDLLRRQQHDLYGALRNEDALQSLAHTQTHVSGLSTHIQSKRIVPRVIFRYQKIFASAYAFEQAVKSLVDTWQVAVKTSMYSLQTPMRLVENKPKSPMSITFNEFVETIEAENVCLDDDVTREQEVCDRMKRDGTDDRLKVLGDAYGVPNENINSANNSNATT